jgi:glycosyltransferase involved in cell wall biosynthesis
MRILYHHRTLADGAEGIHITSMVDAFRALGHEVRVCGAAATSGSQASRAAAVKAWLPGVAFEGASIAYNAPEYFSTRRIIREWRPDLLYKRHARYDVGPLLCARRSHVPIVLEVNAVYSERPYRDFEPQALQPLASRLERAALQLASTVIAVSSPMAAQVARLSGRDAVVVPNGADPTIFDPAAVAPASGPWTGDGLILGWSGGLRAWHGLDLLLEALALLPPHVRVLIVGDGPARPAVEARAAQLGVLHRVFITGLVPRAAMPAYVAAMDIGVVADEQTGVASPMKLLEYMAMGKAVVAPDLPNIRDVVTHDQTGLLFRPGCADDLSGAVTRLGDAPYRQRLGIAARALIVDERNWDAIASLALSMVRSP